MCLDGLDIDLLDRIQGQALPWSNPPPQHLPTPPLPPSGVSGAKAFTYGDENFNLPTEIQRTHKFWRIFRSYWKKNYYPVQCIWQDMYFLNVSVSVSGCFKNILVLSIMLLWNVLCFASGFGFLGITAGFIITSFHTNHFETEDS